MYMNSKYEGGNKMKINKRRQQNTSTKNIKMELQRHRKRKTDLPVSQAPTGKVKFTYIRKHRHTWLELEIRGRKQNENPRKAITEHKHKNWRWRSAATSETQHGPSGFSGTNSQGAIYLDPKTQTHVTWIRNTTEETKCKSKKGDNRTQQKNKWRWSSSVIGNATRTFRFLKLQQARCNSPKSQNTDARDLNSKYERG